LQLAPAIAADYPSAALGDRFRAIKEPKRDDDSTPSHRA
jgi:hypothetical protein